jgi:hypothetical protein
MRLVPFALAACVLGACTPMQWVRDGQVPAPEALQQDTVSCRQQAFRESQSHWWGYRPYSAIGRDPFGRPFGAWPHGYGYPYMYPYGDPVFEEARLAEFCMRAKGYELVPVETGKAR